MDLALQPAVELVQLLRERKLSSLELLDHYLARIERFNPKLNAIVTLDAERAREKARAADTALARGQSWGPLHGLPITVKDTFETAGLRTTAGSPDYKDHVPTHDAAVVSKVRAAGAVIIGKTNTPAMAADWQTFNALFGTTNNPWDLSRAPGGSSGGEAVALAAGLTSLGIGSDIGGSIRVPSHCCGVYGHKPSHGIVPQRGHIPGPPGMLREKDINVVGPMARHASDLELGLGVMAGPDEWDAAAWRMVLPPSRHSSLRDYRVAAWLDDPFCPVDRQVADRFGVLVDSLRAGGVRVDDGARPGFSLTEARRLYVALLVAGSSDSLPQETFDEFIAMKHNLVPADESPQAQRVRNFTKYHREWLMLDEERQRYRQHWATFFQRFDVLLCPVLPIPAIPHNQVGTPMDRTIRVNGDERPYGDQIVWPGLIGMAYLPSTAAPIGRTPEGLPVGVQIVGPYLHDLTTIDFARKLAELIGGFEPPPGFG